MTDHQREDDMTPAEQLAADKPHRARRAATWVCRLRDERKRLGLTLREVSERVGMWLGTLADIERGSEPALTTARKLAAFYGMSVESLWPELATPTEGE